MVTNLFPQILFDAFNLAILIVFTLHTTCSRLTIHSEFATYSKATSTSNSQPTYGNGMALDRFWKDRSGQRVLCK